jgi:hypothetical protein
VDFETVADELYALSPPDFTEARNTRTRDARREGDSDLARRLGALRKPTLAAWASNLLVRTAPEETDRFLALGEELRRAYHDLDGAQLRELARTQRQLIAALSRSARDAAAEAGHPIGDGAQREVELPLQAVLADADAAEQWAAGRLAKPLTPPTGFTTTDLAAVPSERGPEPKQKPEPKGPSKGRSQQKSEPRREVTQLDQARERRRQRQQEADEARRAAEEAAEDAADESRRRENERSAADADMAEAKDRRKAADQRLGEAREALRDAEREQQSAADAEREARDRAQEASRTAHEASRAAREADRAARRAADKADRLTRNHRKH